MLKYMNFTPLQIIGMLVFVACMLGFIIWATGFRKQQREIMKYRNNFFIFSGIILLICIGSLLFKGVNWGLDFKGGTVIEIGVNPKVTAPEIRQAMAEFAKTSKFADKLEDPKIQMEEVVQERQAGVPTSSDAGTSTGVPGMAPVETPAAPSTEIPAAPPVETPAAPNTDMPMDTPAAPPAAPETNMPSEAPGAPPAVTPGEAPAAPPTDTPAAPPAEAPAGTDAPAAPAPAETSSPGDGAGSSQGVVTAQDASASGETQYKKCMIQIKEISSDEASEMIAFLKTKLGDFEVLKQETVGPIIGQELQKKALIALLLALGAQLLYITFRFGTQFRYGVAADIALLHDIIVMVGLYSLLGRPIDSTFLAALLTIIGYSVMDSVVVFDRIRENLEMAKTADYEETVNISLNQTMTRTALTSVTTVMTLFALYYFGGQTLNNFAVALLIGAVAGTYSSLFIASPLLILFDNMAKERENKLKDNRRKKLQDEAEEKARQKNMPREQTQQKPKEQAASKVSGEESEDSGEAGSDEETKKRRDRKRRR